MKKLLFLLCFIIAAFTVKAQNWQATNLTPYYFLPVNAMTVYKNNLYATATSTAIYKLDGGGTSWSQVSTPTNVAGNPVALKGIGSRLYMASSSMLYYSTDGGSTYVPDTVGLPKYGAGVFPISPILSFKSKVIIAMGGNGYYVKDTAAALSTPWYSVNNGTAYSFVGGSDPITGYGDTLYAYDKSGNAKFFVSGDYGTTWNYRATNLPADYFTTILTADELTGRLYTAGNTQGTITVLYYSDNHGASWTQVNNLTPFIKNIQGQGPQQVKAVFAHGNSLFVSLQNNADQTAPDLLGSANGPASLDYDTLGLPANAPGGVFGNSFLMFQNKVTMAWNVKDIYMKGGAATGIKEESFQNNEWVLYPNPASGYIHVLSKKNRTVQEVKLFDYTGKLVMKQCQEEITVLDVSGLAAGIYMIELNSNGRKELQKFIKE